jgi:TrmH family RNA methyltransferase
MRAMDAVAALEQRFRAARLRDSDLAVLEGLHALKHALRFGAALEVVLTDAPEELGELAGALAPDVAAAIRASAKRVSPDVLARIASPRPPTGVVALALRPVVDVPSLLAGGEGFVVLLDAPRHLGNVGAAVRVAAAAGAAGLVTTGDADPWHPAALRGGAGLQFALDVARLERLELVRRPVVALDPDGTPLHEVEVPAGAVLAFGSERRGLSGAVRDRADLTVALPMRAGVSSLNLATSVAATLYALRA